MSDPRARAPLAALRWRGPLGPAGYPDDVPADDDADDAEAALEAQGRARLAETLRRFTPEPKAKPIRAPAPALLPWSNLWGR